MFWYLKSNNWFHICAIHQEIGGTALTKLMIIKVDCETTMTGGAFLRTAIGVNLVIGTLEQTCSPCLGCQLCRPSGHLSGQAEDLAEASVTESVTQLTSRDISYWTDTVMKAQVRGYMVCGVLVWCIHGCTYRCTRRRMVVEYWCFVNLVSVICLIWTFWWRGSVSKSCM